MKKEPSGQIEKNLPILIRREHTSSSYPPESDLTTYRSLLLFQSAPLSEPLRKTYLPRPSHVQWVSEL